MTQLQIRSSWRGIRGFGLRRAVTRFQIRAEAPSSPVVASAETLLLQPEAWPVPRSIHEVSNGKILGFGAELGEDHPGFHDPVYKMRRSMISNLARLHTIGAPIPKVEYKAEETAVWGAVLSELRKQYATHACKEFLNAFPRFNFTEKEVPQLQDLSDILASTSGWVIRPVAGLMHPRDFLNGLAFKYFHSTQYIRHPSRPSYTPEPDVCHELLGHVPMLVDENFSRMIQAIGTASLGASDKEIWHLTKVYWYTVEFGVVMEEGKVKAFGAGILSSFGEMEHMASGRCQVELLDPCAKQPRMSYKDGFQPTYYALNSFEEGTRLLESYAQKVQDERLLA